MKKFFILVSTLFLIVVTSIGVYSYSQKSEPSIVTQGSAMLPDLKKEELIQQSDVIVVAQVKSLKSIKIPSEIRENKEDIATNATLSVEEYLRNYTNNSPQEIVVQTLGGTVGNISMNVEGSAIFKEGEHVLVFLKKKNNDIFSVYGWANGKYTIDIDGKIGIGAQELSYARNVFGSNLTLADVKNQISLFKDIAPKKENSNVNSSLEDNSSMDANMKNSKANSVLNKPSIN